MIAQYVPKIIRTQSVEGRKKYIVAETTLTNSKNIS